MLLVFVPVQLLLCFLFSALLRRAHLSDRTVWLFAAGSGVALLRLTALTPYTLEVDLLSLSVLLMCGAAAPSLLSAPPPTNRLWRAAAVMLLTGFFRELLARGTVLGLAVVSPPTAAVEPIGGLLIAALFLWLFRLAVPVTASSDSALWNTVWLTLAVCSAKALAVAFLPPLSNTWVWGLTLLTAALLSQPEPLRTAWAPLTPLIALPVSADWWHALTAAAATALVLSVADTLTERWRRVPLARSFSGSPAALTLIAITLCAVSSF